MFKHSLFPQLFLILILTLSIHTSFCQEMKPVELQFIPDLPSLNPRDAIFKQYSQDVENAYKAAARQDMYPMFIYAYTTSESDTVISVASRCNIPKETVALLNNLSSASEPVSGKTLYLPVNAGLFIPETPKTVLAQIVKKRLLTENFAFEQYQWYSINGENFCFIPNERLTPTENYFFLDSGMKSPLPEGILTSPYGMRISPISGTEKFHSGIDLAAPEGTAVYACLGGTVLVAATDATYGNYIILQHANGLQSVYAHLSGYAEGMKEAGTFVTAGDVIGYVGTTGASTGPHLHFEIRTGNGTTDPESLLP
ncbi:MAG: M23 family metallopeptidase [Treponema sp.]|nr:M23 family metallopeptidase [Candidatus Treponema caballi]